MYSSSQKTHLSAIYQTTGIQLSADNGHIGLTAFVDDVSIETDGSAYVFFLVCVFG